MSLSRYTHVQVSSQLIKAMLQLLKDNKDLLARKRLYTEFGCRGDWPNVSAWVEKERTGGLGQGVNKVWGRQKGQNLESFGTTAHKN